MEVKRILYFLDFPFGFGGAANTIIKQAELMKKAGAKVAIVIPLDRNGQVVGEFERRCLLLDLDYYFMKYSVTANPEDVDVVSLLEDYRDVEGFIKKWNPDIVHSTQINLAAEMVCRKIGIPHIMNIYQIEDRFFGIDYGDIFPRYHICDSELYREKWKKYIQVESVCIRNCCQEIHEKKSERGIPTFICAGILCERKNQMEVIKAFRLLLKNGMDAKLILVGKDNSDYGRKCIEYVQQNNLSERVEIRGFVPSAEYEIAKCDALVCGSTMESFPNVIGEAMASNVAVISTPVAGVPEILKDDENAYLTGGYEAEDIYLALVRFYTQWNTTHQRRVIKNAFETYKREFSPNAITEKLIEFYRYVSDDIRKKDSLPIQIEWFAEKYGQYVEVFLKNEDKFKKKESTRRMIWMLPFIQEILEMKTVKELAIWGAGALGAEAKIFADIFFPKIKVVYFLDQKKQGEYLGIPIVKPEKIYWEKRVVWIANLAGQSEIMEVLRINGKKYREDFFIMAPKMW